MMSQTYEEERLAKGRAIIADQADKKTPSNVDILENSTNVDIKAECQ